MCKRRRKCLISHLKFVLGGPVAMSVVGMIAIKGHRAARGRLRLVFAGVKTTMAHVPKLQRLYYD